MASRLELHEKLVETLGSRNVYFQPPSNLKLKYPAIVYQRNSTDTKDADDIRYHVDIEYMITVIDPDPDSEVVDRMMNFPRSRYVRNYVADNLNHDVFTLYY